MKKARELWEIAQYSRQRRRAKTHSRHEKRSLARDCRLNQFQFLARRQHFVLPLAETLEILSAIKRARRSRQTSSRNGGSSVADEKREQFFRDGEDMAARSRAEAIVKNAGFQRPGA